jgi:heme/copper-type cytochrome/quinol oxidase subunit 3
MIRETRPSAGERRAPVPVATGRLGMRLLLASLTMLFAASLMGYLVIRGRAAAWPPPGVPRLPASLWISTVIIVLCSVAVQAAVRAARAGRNRALRIRLLVTGVLGVAFLVSQTLNWFALVAARLTIRTNLYGFTLFLLTGLHAAHVIGGLVPLALVTVRAWRRRYSAQFHAGVEYCATYWHFLDVVWLGLFAVLTLTS